ncbi:MAG TPA: hypothetical protein VH722_07500 [Alphaproteobacteria bacterium]|jgi:energy-coupling factor transporter transmembrane protein EcfT|nr:hypothetical protein [Alphaproteobacteria bacterium]
MQDQDYEVLGHTVANVTALATFIATWVYGAVAFGLIGASVAWLAAGVVGVAAGVGVYHAWMFFQPAVAGTMLPLVVGRRQ